MNSLSLGQCASMACLLEASAPKVGNVNRSADFADMTFLDFAASAVAIGPVFERANELSVGKIVLEGVRATRRVTSCNTNLGILLLLSPLAKASTDGLLRSGVSKVLANLDHEDCQDVYRAIRLANPGGMGQVQEQDVSSQPDTDLISAMNMARDRDLVARQYCENFNDVFECVLPELVIAFKDTTNLPEAIVLLQIRLMSRFTDSLIARKCGSEIAEQAKIRATAIADLAPGTDAYYQSLSELDFWLRSDSNRRNPGTIADLITAGLFVALIEQTISPPFKFGD